MDIMKAIIPAAGLGTRFLPYTRAVAKELLPLLHKPAIHYTVEEAMAAQLNQLIVVTSQGKEALLNYFNPFTSEDSQPKNASDAITTLKKISRCVEFSYVRQSEPLGLGHAVFMARHFIGKEQFAVLLPDDLILDTQPAIGQLIRIARQEKGCVLAVQEVPTNLVSSYGIISVKRQITPNLFQVGGLLEKPHPKDAPSRLAVVGRYVLSHKIFPALEAISQDAEGEIQLTEAIDYLARTNERIFAYKIPAPRFDLGTPAGWLKANIHLGLRDTNLGAEIRSFIFEEETLMLANASSREILAPRKK